jgi:AraC family transcriptional regulator
MPASVAYRLEFRDLPEQIVGSIRGRVAVDGLGSWIADAIEELFNQLAVQGIRPAGAPFAIMPAPNGGKAVAVEVALPAIREVAQRGRVQGRVVPACRALTTLHYGAYDELDGAYQALAAAMEEQGIAPAAEPREVYLTNPREIPPDDSQTELIWPVAVPSDWVPAGLARGFPPPLG